MTIAGRISSSVRLQQDTSFTNLERSNQAHPPSSRISMSRTATMATGFFLILAGIQLHVVESFTMTPRVAHFLNDKFSQPSSSVAPILTNSVAAARNSAVGQNYNSPYYQASYSQPSGNQLTSPAPIASVGSNQIVPPRWFCWPVLFLGAFLLLQGATKPRD